MKTPANQSHTQDEKLDYRIVQSNLNEFLAEPVASIPTWVDKKYLTRSPFAFMTRDFEQFRELTSDMLDIEYQNIWCTGSGALGFSLSPSKIANGKPKFFDTGSDLDIAIISTHYFDMAWKELREKSKSFEVENQLRNRFSKKMELQRKRLFDGAIQTDRMLPYLSFGEDWMKGLGKMKNQVAVTFNRSVDVKFWIYRDIWSVRYYVAEGAKKVKGSLT
ncbi:hypothetical protein [Kocuria sp. cx-455]|uniref:hypothetical protein n=1 Tax=Kocuria sp. cx-455 TaxID=2771377 RepID=UPI003D72013D